MVGILKLGREPIDFRFQFSEKDFDALVDAIEPGSDGLFFVPHLGGQNGPIRTSIRGSWLGLEWSHGRGNLARAVLEALAFESAIAIDAMSLPHEGNSL